MEQVLGDRIDDGCIIVKHGHTEPLQRIRQYEASHPVPAIDGERATRELLKTVANLTREDRVFALLTGGASALLVAPPPELTLSDKAIVTELLLRSGAGIAEINTVRKQISLVKGGGLLRALGPAPAVSLLISDVPDRDPTMIGSAPLRHDATTATDALSILGRRGILELIPRNVVQLLQRRAASAPQCGSHHCAAEFVLADSSTVIAAAAQRARECAFDVEIVEPEMNGDAHEHAKRFAAAMVKAARSRRTGDRPLTLISAGETTLKVTGSGRGGRNQEFALAAATELQDTPGVALLAAGTDGTDGPTDAAGAFADDTTVARAARFNKSIAAALADNDSYPLLHQLGDLYSTGPTGTNVRDLVLGWVGPPGHQ